MRGASITRFHSYCNMSLHNTQQSTLIERRAITRVRVRYTTYTAALDQYANTRIIQSSKRRRERAPHPASHAESSKLGHASIACKRPSTQASQSTSERDARCAHLRRALARALQ